MPIPFLCSGCGRSYRVADDRAGRRMRCAACGQITRAPTFIPTPPPIQVDDEPADDLLAPSVAAIPTALDALQVDDEPLTDPRRPRLLGGALRPVLAGLLIGGVAIGLLFAFRDQVHEVAPALMPARPAAAPEPPQPPAAEGDHDPVHGRAVVAVVIGIVVLVVVAATFILPLALPIVLSLRGFLSVGRWAALAGFFIWSGAMASVLTIRYYLSLDMLHREAFGILFSIAGFLIFIFNFVACGCLFAAAIHPKPKA